VCVHHQHRGVEQQLLSGQCSRRGLQGVALQQGRVHQQGSGGWQRGLYEPPQPWQLCTAVVCSMLCHGGCRTARHGFLGAAMLVPPCLGPLCPQACVWHAAAAPQQGCKPSRPCHLARPDSLEQQPLKLLACG
jgi:hypothetical protein